ncbi:MAG: hypothetical protein WCL00_06205, partial [Bacteroidota bacterium]
MYGLNIWHKKNLLIFFFLFFYLFTFSQNEKDYDELSVFLNIYKIGGKEVPAIFKDESLYLPVVTVFDLLKIRNVPTAGFDSVSGFFIQENAPFLICVNPNKILFQGKDMGIPNSALVQTEDNLYLRINYFGEIFGLDCQFDFQSLSVSLKTKLELPVIREMRLAMMRQNMNRLKGEIRADSIFQRKYPFFHVGNIDWSIISTEVVKGKANLSAGVKLGGVIAGGETNIALIYSNIEPFTERKQFYYWHFVNNDLKLFKQIIVGKQTTKAISFLSSPVVGVRITNAPTTFRRSFSSYTLSDYTQPGWIVELYVNNVLVDYIKADAHGFFTFEVPLVYGTSLVNLHFYGPWGEERSLEKSITIPFNFLPPRKLEYNIHMGVIEDDVYNKFS